jgi:predicted RNA-binding protein with PIN domain
MNAPRVDWSAVPDPVRARLADLVARALGGLAEAEIPQRLRPVARFAPAKRAKVAGGQLVTALAESKSFRAAVVAWAQRRQPHILRPPADDVVGRAVVAMLLETDDAEEVVTAAAERAEEADLRAERDALRARVQRLEAEVAKLRDELDEQRAATAAARAEREQELDRLRQRLRERGMQLRQAREETQKAREELAGAGTATDDKIAELTERLAREQQRAAAERARADRATEQLEAMRSGVDQQLRGDQARLSLLLDTVAGAVEGLRGELRLQAGTPGHRPADAVAGATTGGKARSVVNDPVVLERLLGVPNTHMIVDGYNVTKTGYPDLPLAEQRERLIRQLAPLAARTGVEVTVVFDGAGVVAPASRVRNVRVLFSEPGVSADEVIKNLVAAEPSGRPLLVVTADREIVRAVRDHDARAVSSAVLLEVVQPG